MGRVRQKTCDDVGTSGRGSLCLRCPGACGAVGEERDRRCTASQDSVWTCCPPYKQWDALKDCKPGTDGICLLDGSFASVGKRLAGDRDRSHIK